MQWDLSLIKAHCLGQNILLLSTMKLFTTSTLMTSIGFNVCHLLAKKCHIFLKWKKQVYGGVVLLAPISLITSLSPVLHETSKASSSFNSDDHCESHPVSILLTPFPCRFIPQHSGDRAGGKVQETSEPVILGFPSGCGSTWCGRCHFYLHGLVTAIANQWLFGAYLCSKWPYLRYYISSKGPIDVCICHRSLPCCCLAILLPKV